MNRLFVSLNLSSETIDKIVNVINSIWDDTDINWEPKEKLHLTLKFIGDVPTNVVDKITSELSFVESYSEIKCSFNKFGYFYRDTKPIILWAGLNTEDTLSDLINTLNIRLSKYSIPNDKRKFNAHITLLRIKKELGVDFINKFKNFTFSPVKFTANNITLYKSILLKQSSKYFEIKNYKLKEMET